MFKTHSGSRGLALLLVFAMVLSAMFAGGAGTAKAAGYTVVFKNGNTVVSQTSVNGGEKVSSAAAPAVDGYAFAGWFTQNVGVISDVTAALNYVYDFSKAVNSNLTLYAGWINAGTDANGRFVLQGVQYRARSEQYSAGLRFMTKMDDSFIADIKNLSYKNMNIKPESSDDKGLGYGTVVTFAENLSTGKRLVKDVDATSLAKGFVVIPAVYTYSKTSNATIYTAMIVNIPQSYFNQHLAARPYITYADANGVVRTYYYSEVSGTTHKAGGAYYISYNEALNNNLNADAINVSGNETGSGNEGNTEKPGTQQPSTEPSTQPAEPSTQPNVEPSTENPGSNLEGDIPQMNPSVTARDNNMYFLMNNKTNGQYSDSQIYWCVLGYNESMQLCYVNKDGQMIPATTALNTITKGDRKCADICYSLAEKNYLYMPDVTSGRMYISYGSPVYITINQDINGNIGYAGPDLNNTSDPNQDVLFEFVEFTIKNKEYWGNTTRVDFFSFPIVSRLYGTGGFCNYPGDADVYDKTVGDLGTRAEIFSAFNNEVPAEFRLLANDKRIMAPCKSVFNEGQAYGNYFDNYINQFWTKYASQDLVFSCDAGTFRGRVSGDVMVFTKDGSSETATIYKPTTQHVLEGKGNFDRGTSLEKVIEAQMCAAFNRGIALNPELWSNRSTYYQSAPCNYYAGFFHNHSYSGLAYGFCYDDVFDNSTLLHYTNPTGLIMDLRW